jgi:CRP-like cAMP-binding protein
MNQYEYFKKFSDINSKDYDLLTQNLKKRNFKKGEVIIAPGQVQKELYFVKSGVQMSFFDAETKPQVIAFTYSPDICAIPDSFNLQTPSKYFLTALTNSELEYLTYEELKEILDKSHALERLFRRMTEAVLAGVLYRHMELHTLSMEERFINFCRRSPHLLQLVPHKYLASYLGIDPTNFSKLYNSVKI